MTESAMAFWLSILWPVQAILDSFIIFYSMVRYTMLREYRDLLLLFLSVNLLLVGFFYVLTNASSIVLSPFADRDRNRTIVASIGFILGPSILLGSLKGTTEEHRTRAIASTVWGAFIVPFIEVAFMVSPEPVFITKPIGAGPLSLSPLSWIIMFITLPSLIVSVYKIAKAWIDEQNTMDLALFYAIILWCCAIVGFVVQTHPLQAMELIWYSFFMAGTLLIAIAGVMTAVVDPQRELTYLVERRTKELEESKQESEYYLNLWGHKIGNLLQAITIYLEMMEDRSESSPALELSRKTALINRQVSTLIEIKETIGQELVPVPLVPHVQRVQTQAEDMTRLMCTYDVTIPPDVTVIADRMLEFVFLNVISYICEENPKPHIKITAEKHPTSVIVDIISPGTRVPSAIVESFVSELVPTRTTMSLDLFIVKILMERYDGQLLYSFNEDTQSNKFTLRFNRAQS